MLRWYRKGLAAPRGRHPETPACVAESYMVQLYLHVEVLGAKYCTVLA